MKLQAIYSKIKRGVKRKAKQEFWSYFIDMSANRNVAEIYQDLEEEGCEVG
jgi:hypothetical protein